MQHLLRYAGRCGLLMGALVLGLQPLPAQTMAMARQQTHNTPAPAVQVRRIQDVLNELKTRYQTDILYEDKTLEGLTVPANLLTGTTTLPAALDRLLKPFNLRYKQVKAGTWVVLVRRGERSSTFADDAPRGNNADKAGESVPAPMVARNGQAPPDPQPDERTILGRVTDAETSQGLPGVSVVAKGTNRGTTTDAEGNYRIGLPDPANILVFSYVGYERQELAVGTQARLDVALRAGAGTLAEVVVVGYGVQKKSDLTGAVSSVTARDFRDQPVVDAAQALQGRAAGVSIAATSGAPGGEVKIRIRGSNSINASNDPLYVVDGVALASVGLQDINVNDIETMEVLKDASATAIYGSRGANGVIMITTKSGKAGTMQVNYNAFVSVSSPMRQYDLLDPVAYARLANQIEGKSVFPNPESLAGTGTDWQNSLFQTGLIQNHQLSVAGGTEKSRYYVSGYLVDQTGLITNTGQKKFSLRSNIDTKLSEKFSLGLNLFAGRTNAFNTGDMGGKGNPVMSMLGWAPTEAIYDDPATGEYNRQASSPIWPNPYMMARERNSQSFTNVAIANGRLRYAILEGLTFEANAGLNLNLSRGAFLNNRWVSPGNEGAGQWSNENVTWQLSNVLTYHKTIRGQHDLIATAVFEETANTNSGFNASGSGLTSTANGFNNLALNRSQSIGSGYNNWALRSYVGRLAYVFRDRYLLTATYRADGSSKFQTTANKWGFFPSAAVGWRISEEPFMKDLNLFSNLKARASWGVTGNQAIGPYSSLGLLSPARYSFGTTTLYQGYMPGNLANPNLRWETTTQTNIGLDVGLWSNRLNITLDYFNKQTNDLLLEVPVPSYDGGGVILQNIGRVENKGFELALDGTPVRTGKFSWTTAFNITTYQNRVLSLGKDSLIYRPYIGRGLINTNIQVVQVGQPLGAFYLIPWEGIYQANDNVLGFKAGDNRYADVNRDEKIGYEDRKIVGSARPTLQWGFTNNLRYGNFDLNVFIQGSHGNRVFNATYAAIAAPNGDVKYPTLRESADMWTPQNTGAAWANAASLTNRNYIESTRYLQDGGFVRVRNVSLSYTIPKNVLRVVSLRLTASAQNVFMLTRYKGFDPEASSTGSSTTGSSDADAAIDLGAYPSPRTFTFGLNATF